MKRVGWLMLMGLIAGCATSAPVGIPAAVTAPDFTLKALDGRPIHLADYRGRLVLVNFWATYCVPCTQEMPLLQRYQNAHSDRVSVLGVNMREDPAAVRAFAEKLGVSYPLLLAPDDQTLLGYGVRGLPITAIIGVDGVLLQTVNGAISQATLDNLLRQADGG